MPSFPVEVFYTYAYEDELLRVELEKHLSLLHRQGLIAAWHNRHILAGADWTQAVDTHLEQASVILLLVSADFLVSDYCYGIEMQRALERHEAKLACVIPVLLRSVDWQGAPFAHLQALPTNAKAITAWSNQDEAFTSVASSGTRATTCTDRVPGSFGCQDQLAQLLHLVEWAPPPASVGFCRLA